MKSTPQTHLYFSFTISLERRVEYLSRAIANGRSALNSRDREETERLRELQEKLEVMHKSHLQSHHLT
jgi:hypothetical protein